MDKNNPKLIEILQAAAGRVRKKISILDPDELISIGFLGRIKDIPDAETGKAFKCAVWDMLSGIRTIMHRNREVLMETEVLDLCTPLVESIEEKADMAQLLNFIIQEADLSSKEKDIIYYIYYQNLPFYKIAENIKETEDKVAKMLANAMNKLRRAAGVR